MKINFEKTKDMVLGKETDSSIKIVEKPIKQI